MNSILIQLQRFLDFLKTLEINDSFKSTLDFEISIILKQLGNIEKIVSMHFFVFHI